MRYAQRATSGQVMIEFALAAAGLVAIAFLTARVGLWLNQSLVERNAGFQASRWAAGQPGDGEAVGFSAPSEIHLIGEAGGAQRAPGGTGSPPPDPIDTSCTVEVDGVRQSVDEVLQRAADKRQEAVDVLDHHASLGGEGWDEVRGLQRQAKERIEEAKALRNDADTIDDLNDNIATKNKEITDKEVDIHTLANKEVAIQALQSTQRQIDQKVEEIADKQDEIDNHPRCTAVEWTCVVDGVMLGPGGFCGGAFCEGDCRGELVTDEQCVADKAVLEGQMAVLQEQSRTLDEAFTQLIVTLGGDLATLESQLKGLEETFGGNRETLEGQLAVLEDTKQGYLDDIRAIKATWGTDDPETLRGRATSKEDEAEEKYAQANTKIERLTNVTLGAISDVVQSLIREAERLEHLAQTTCTSGFDS